MGLRRMWSRLTGKSIAVAALVMAMAAFGAIIKESRQNEDISFYVNQGGTITKVAAVNGANGRFQADQITDLAGTGAPNFVNGADGVLPAGMIVAYGGSSAPDGWLMLDGACVADATYPDLESAIGPTVSECDSGGGAGSGFTLPDMRGEFARGLDDMGTAEGARGVDSGRSLLTTQTDATDQNGLSLSGSAPSLTGTTSFASTSHTHASGNLIARVGMSDSGNEIRMDSTTASGVYGTDFEGSLTTSVTSDAVGNGAVIQGSSAGPSSNASVGITGGSFSIGASDGETRPRNVAFNYIIKT